MSQFSFIFRDYDNFISNQKWSIFQETARYSPHNHQGLTGVSRSFNFCGRILHETAFSGALGSVLWHFFFISVSFFQETVWWILWYERGPIWDIMGSRSNCHSDFFVKQLFLVHFLVIFGPIASPRPLKSYQLLQVDNYFVQFDIMVAIWN